MTSAGLTRGLRTLGSLGAALALTVAGATTATADGLHLLPKQWTGGCAINYSMDARTEAEYGPNIAAGLESIHQAAGFGFTRVGFGDPGASIRYTVVDSLKNGYAGLAFSNGDIQLLDSSALTQSNSPALNSLNRDVLVIHETLHVLGLDHDADEGSSHPDEMMYPQGTWGQLLFGEGDREGMAHVSAANGCVAPDPGAQPVPAIPLTQPTVARPPSVTVPTTSDAGTTATTPSTATTSTPTKRRSPTGLERCLALHGFKAKTAKHYCPPLKREVYVSPGQHFGSHRPVSHAS